MPFIAFVGFTAAGSGPFVTIFLRGSEFLVPSRSVRLQ